MSGLTPEAMHIFSMIVLAGMLGGFVVAIVATGRAMYQHEKRQKGKDRSL